MDDAAAEPAPPEVIARARQLTATLAELLGTLELQKVPLERLTSLHASAEGLVAGLMDLHDNYVSLHGPLRNGVLSPALELWRNLEAGKVRPDALGPVRQASPTLTTLYKNGLDVRGATRFTVDEIDLATSLADGFDGYWLAWDRFKAAHAKRENYFPFVKREFGNVKRFFNTIKQRGVIRSYSFGIYYVRDDKWKAIDEKGISYLSNENQPLAVRFEVADERLARFLEGRWLAAFTYRVIDDHLSRNDVDFEIYSELRFGSAEGVITVAGDFDVLARSSDTILAVECKSGRLREDEDANRHDVIDVVEKANRLKEALVRTGATVDNFAFWLVYNPHMTSKAVVESKSEGTGISAITPLDIRREILRVFGAT